LTRPEFDKLDDAMKTRAFTVAYLQQDYQLDRVHGRLDEALREGHSIKRVVRDLEKDFARWGVTETSRHHLETVATTNMLGSYQHGRLKQMGSASMRKLLPYWQYWTVGDRRVRPTHREMEGKVYPNDHPIWATWYPPNGFRCRCTVSPMDAETMRAEGLGESSEPPKLKGKPVEPDKGFKTGPQGFLQQKGRPRILPKQPKQTPKPSPKPAKRPKRSVKPRPPLPQPVAVHELDVSKLTAEDVKKMFDYDLNAAIDPATITPRQWRKAKRAFERAAEDFTALRLDATRPDLYFPAAGSGVGRRVHEQLLEQRQLFESLDGVFAPTKAIKSKAEDYLTGPWWKPGARKYGEDVLNGLAARKLNAGLVDRGYYKSARRQLGIELAGLFEPSGPDAALAAKYHFPTRAPLVTMDLAHASRRTATHEFAHAVDHLLTERGLRRVWEKLPVEYVTEYAKTNVAEDVAESFTLFMNSGKIGTAPQRTALLKKITRSAGAEMGPDFERFEPRRDALFILRQAGSHFGTKQLLSAEEALKRLLALE
jgi:SPP1 gp7 family putative phage head morphogenesis protein